MAELLTSQELESLRESGAEITREPREVIAPTLDSAVSSITQAINDKSNAEVVKSINALAVSITKSVPKQTDIAPVVDAIKDFTDAILERPAYEFKVTRNRKEQITTIIASPLEG